MQALHKGAIHGLPPWDKRSMALHASAAVDSVDFVALASAVPSADARLRTLHGGVAAAGLDTATSLSDTGPLQGPPVCLNTDPSLKMLPCCHTVLHPCHMWSLIVTSLPEVFVCSKGGLRLFDSLPVRHGSAPPRARCRALACRLFPRACSRVLAGCR